LNEELVNVVGTLHHCVADVADEGIALQTEFAWPLAEGIFYHYPTAMRATVGVSFVDSAFRDLARVVAVASGEVGRQAGGGAVIKVEVATLIEVAGEGRH
jgi:hypothetical protein